MKVQLDGSICRVVPSVFTLLYPWFHFFFLISHSNDDHNDVMSPSAMDTPTNPGKEGGDDKLYCEFVSPKKRRQRNVRDCIGGKYSEIKCVRSLGFEKWIWKWIGIKIWNWNWNWIHRNAAERIEKRPALEGTTAQLLTGCGDNTSLTDGILIIPFKEVGAQAPPNPILKCHLQVACHCKMKIKRPPQEPPRKHKKGCQGLEQRIGK